MTAGQSVPLAVESISWERIHMAVRLRLAFGTAQEGPARHVSFAFTDGSRVLDVPSSLEADGTHVVRVNVTNFDDRKAVPDGTWRIRATVDGISGPIASFESSDLDHLDQASKVFLHDATVSYEVDENREDPARLDFLIRTYHRIVRRLGPRRPRSSRARGPSSSARTRDSGSSARSTARSPASSVRRRGGSCSPPTSSRRWRATSCACTSA